jgi:hypothetical protein
MALPWVSLAVSRSTTHSKSAAPLGVPEEHSLTWCVELEGVYKCNSALLALASVACVTGADQPRWPQVPAHGVVCVCVSAYSAAVPMPGETSFATRWSQVQDAGGQGVRVGSCDCLVTLWVLGTAPDGRAGNHLMPGW